MKKETLITIAMIAFLIAATSCGTAAAEMKAASVKGDSELIRAGQSSVLKKDMAIMEGDVIKTAAGAEVTITWGDGHLVKIYPLSKFVMEAASVRGDVETNTLNIESGKIFAKARKLVSSDSIFEIRTPTARAGVRGSEIFVTAASDVSNFAVISGAFSITTEGLDVVLNQNYQIDVGVAPEEVEMAEPVPISADDLQEMKTEMDAIYEEAEVETVGAAPEEAGDVTEETTEDINERTGDSINENVINDTITIPATEGLMELLEAGKGGANVIID